MVVETADRESSTNHEGVRRPRRDGVAVPARMTAVALATRRTHTNESPNMRAPPGAECHAHRRHDHAHERSNR